MWFSLLSLAFAGVTASIQKGVVVRDEGTGVEVSGHLLVDEQLTYDISQAQAGLKMQRLRPDLRVGLGEIPVRARLQMELGPKVALLDAYLDIGPKKAFLRIGRGLLPSGRAQLTAVPKLLFQGFAPSSNASRVGRQLGIMGAASPGPVDLQVGVYGDGFDEDVGYRGIARAALDIGAGVPYDETSALSGEAKPGMTLAVSGQWWSVDQTATGLVEFAAQAGPVRLQAEGFLRTNDEKGGYVQLSSTVIRKRLDVGLRVDKTMLTDKDGLLLEGVVSGYLVGPHLRLQAGYAGAVLGQIDHRVLVNAQLYF